MSLRRGWSGVGEGFVPKIGATESLSTELLCTTPASRAPQKSLTHTAQDRSSGAHT